MSDPLVSLVRARTPSMLYAMVMDEVQRGYFLSQPLFVGNDLFLCQWVELGNDFLDYRLVEAPTCAELESNVRTWVEQGYYLVFKTETFAHGYLQWVAKSKTYAETISHTVATSLVEDARPVMRLAPVSFVGVPEILKVIS